MSESDQEVFRRVQKRMDDAAIRIGSPPRPTVACVMLANGRPEMVARAVKSFRAQTYARKHLWIIDSGRRMLTDSMRFGENVYHCPIVPGTYSIGALRNRAAEISNISDFGGIVPDDSGQIICHWDSDDWSHPNRIAEQVALLQSSGAECVGYDEMLFWDITKPKTPPCPFPSTIVWNGQAWLYRAAGNKALKSYAIGTSMCYWRSTWERFPFPDYSPGCDDMAWSTGDPKKGLSAVKIVSDSANALFRTGQDGMPRMIASIHGGNTCAKIDATSTGGKEVWTRVPKWDAYCRSLSRNSRGLQNTKAREMQSHEL